MQVETSGLQQEVRSSKDRLCGKYGEVKREWCSKEASEGYGVGLWKAIRNL